jgi:hypothetical protein
VEDIGNAGWDPICFATNEGFLHYFPALARIALDEPSHGYGWYFEQLLFHLTYEGSSNRRLLAASSRQREVIGLFLRHVQTTRPGLVAEYMCEEGIKQALGLWTVGKGVVAPGDHRER